jgi:hypothetical protein
LVALLTIILLVLGMLVSLNLADSGRSLLDFRGAALRGLQSLRNLLPPSPEVLVMALTVYIWRRGVVSASNTYLEQGRTGLKFRIGVLIFIIYAFVRGRSTVPPALPLFFFSSLLAMSLTRANQITKQSAGGNPPFSLTWVLSLGALFFVTMSAGLLAGQLFASSLVDRLFGGLRLLLLRVFLFIYQLLLPLLLALDAIFQQWVSNLTQEPEVTDTGPLEDLIAGASDWIGRDSPLFVQRLNEFLASLAVYWPTIRIVLISLVVLLVIVSSIRLVLRRSRQVAQGDLATDEGEDLPLEVKTGWRRRIRDFGKELRSWGRAAVSGQLSTAILVRRLYGKLLQLAAEHGRSRYQWETPLEFQGALGQLFPNVTEEIETLTTAYVQVRYGQLAETNELVNDVRQAWDKIVEENR